MAPPKPAADQSTLPFEAIHDFDYLNGLNKNQKAAVVYPNEGGLQILAGPGSGKTRVLTTRVAYLIQKYKVSPETIVVVTFTNKAANEMRMRLEKLVGASITSKLIMGTFHSVCVKYLRKYYNLVGLPQGFTIADRDSCLALLKTLLSHPPPPPSLSSIKAPVILDFISKQKSLGYDPDVARAMIVGDGVKREEWEWKVDAYERYQAALKDAGAVDFDDLLSFGLKLFKAHPRVATNIRSVLIDEFQDTNVVQFELVKYLAHARRSLTIVGDPDQSIYGWRNAEVENLDRMTQEYKPVKQIYLEENYRSTGAILGAALAVVQQDKARIQKTLVPTHPTGTSVVLSNLPTAQSEAYYIGKQVKHLIAHSGGTIDYGDCAVLLRYGALSRNIEMEFKKMGVPCRMVGGHKFFDRVEVKDILAYLQLVDNTSYTPALLRVINVPKRGLGDKTLKDLIEAAKQAKVSPFDMAVRVVNGSGKGGFGESTRKRFKEFVLIVREAMKEVAKGIQVADLIDKIIQLSAYESHLERTYAGEIKERMENINELKSYAATVAEENDQTDDGVEMEEVVIPALEKKGNGTGLKGHASRELLEEFVSSQEEIVMPPSSQVTEDEPENPLRTFLAVSMLATDTDTEDAKQDANQRKVTISTCHAAKGLEWPVVFVPACEEGIYPFYRASEAKEQDEERRLLYVAITRAQVFCTLTHAESRMVGSEHKKKSLTPFLIGVSQQYPTLFKSTLQKITAATRSDLGRVLNKTLASEEETAIAIRQHTASLGPDPEYFTAGAPISAGGNRFGGFQSFGSQRYSGSSFSRHGAPATQGAGSMGWKPMPTGAGIGGFSSALSSFNKSALPPKVTTTTGSSASTSTGWKPQVTQAKFVPPRPATATSSAFVPPRPAPPAITSGKGSLTLPETRSSKINDVVLLNPVVKPPGQGLLAGFQSSEKRALEEMRGLGSPEKDAVGESGSSSLLTSRQDGTGRGARKKVRKS